MSANHPTWCSPNRCDATDPNLPGYEGAHRSEPIDLGAQRLSVGHHMVQVTSASLFQAAAPWSVSTYLLLQADGVALSMPVTQAASVLTQLTQLIERS